MGVLFDYFRAPSRPAVADLMNKTDGSSPVIDGVWEGVEAKGVDPVVALGQVIAFALEVDYSLDLVESDLVWPDEGDMEGPIVTAIGERATNALAGITPDRLHELARRWADIEEFRPLDEEAVGYLADGLNNLAELARRAQANADQLYCWCSV